MDIKYKLVIVEDLTNKELDEIKSIQKVCFPEVSEEEVKEDFYDHEVVRILAYANKQIVGCAGIHLRDREFKGKKYLLGGPSGFCVPMDVRGNGIGSKLCELAMAFLQESDCSIAFLSVAKDSIARSMYQKFGFVDLPVEYSWKKSDGTIGRDHDGMIAPVCDVELFNEILLSTDEYYVGEGYW